MENDEKNEGTSVDQPEPVERATEEDFEILDIRDAQEADITEGTETQNTTAATGKEENAVQIDRLEEVGNTDRHEVAGGKEIQNVADETNKQTEAGIMDKTEVTGATDKKTVTGKTGKEPDKQDNVEEAGEQGIADDAEIMMLRGATGKDDTENERKTDIEGDMVGILAKPKESASQAKWEKEGVIHVDFFESGRRPKPCKLEFLGDRAVKIDNEEVAVSKLRYATRREYKSFPQRAAHCIIVSYVAVTGPGEGGEGLVKHSFLEMPDVKDTINLEQDFMELLIRKFQKTLDLDQTNLDCLETVNEQPLIFEGADVIIRDANDRGNSIYDGRCLVVLDIECLSIYPVINKEMKEPHRLMFWKEEGDNSVEKILHYTKTEKIVFETSTAMFELPVIGNIIEQLHELDPKVKGLLHDKDLLNQWVTTTRRSKKKPSSASASLYPEIHQAHNAEARRRPAREWERPADTGTEWERPADTGTEVWEYHQRQQIENTIVRELNTELNNAVESFATNEDMQMYWITVEEDLRLIIESGCVHETDHYSGGLDPDNGDHLKRALNDVADQISEQQLEMAVSRIQAARRMFSGSHNAEISGIFQVDDMELLRKLYFRSLVK